MFTGLGLLLPFNPDVILETGVTLVFYGVYYGVMGRDCAEVCVDYMSAAMTVRGREGGREGGRGSDAKHSSLFFVFL